jgi:hypothetical protein
VQTTHNEKRGLKAQLGEGELSEGPVPKLMSNTIEKSAEVSPKMSDILRLSHPISKVF